MPWPMTYTIIVNTFFEGWVEIIYGGEFFLIEIIIF